MKDKNLMNNLKENYRKWKFLEIIPSTNRGGGALEAKYRFLLLLSKFFG